MEHTKNPNYGRLKCFHCLLSPDGDDPIFVGINRLVAKGLATDEKEKRQIKYPCQVVNRFECPYERAINKGNNNAGATNSYFDVEDLFRLQKFASVVEIALANARRHNSEIKIKDKQDLFHALKDRNILIKILQQADDILKSTSYFREISSGHDNYYIADYFMRLRNKIALEELRFY